MEIAGRNPLAEENAEFDKLVLRNVFQVSQFHKKYHINRRCLKKEILHYWLQVKEIIKKSNAYSFLNKVRLPSEIKYNCTKINEIWKMNVSHFADF